MTIKKSKLDFGKRIFIPGTTVGCIGKRGKGKTHWLVICIEILVALGYEVMTNILFQECIAIKNGNPIYKEKYPEHVHKVTTFADMVRTMIPILEANRDTPIALFWDECQNFMHSYRAVGRIAFSILQFHGIARKFNLVMVEITPTLAGIVGDVQKHYMDFLFDKSITLTYEYNKMNGTKHDPKELVFLKTMEQHFAGFPGLPIKVPIGKMAMPKGKHKVGRIYYDHLASGDFDMGTLDNGEPFVLKDFTKCISNVISQEVPEQMKKYMAGIPLTELLASKMIPTKCRTCGRPVDTNTEEGKKGFCTDICEIVFKEKKTS